MSATDLVPVVGDSDAVQGRFSGRPTGERGERQDVQHPDGAAFQVAHLSGCVAALCAALHLKAARVNRIEITSGSVRVWYRDDDGQEYERGSLLAPLV